MLQLIIVFIIPAAEYAFILCRMKIYDASKSFVLIDKLAIQ